MLRPALLLALICVTVTAALAEKNAPVATSPTAGSTNPLLATKAAAKAPAASNSWKALLLPREEIPDERNALVRWRPSFEKLQPDTVETSQLLQNLSSPIEDVPAINDPTLKKWLSDVTPTVNDLVLHDGETFQLPILRGPETPFPDHYPLRQLAIVRIALMKAAWLDGRTDEALALAIDNLRLSRAFLGSQEALIALIQATGVWQISLDGIYWLARQENLSPETATRLQTELLADERIASSALIRAFRSEFTFFTHLVIERLPKTKDVNVLLAGIATLGMTPPEPTNPNEPHLATPERDPFDREATLQLSADDISGWITAFGKNRHPDGLTARHTAPQLQAYAKEIEPLLLYANAEVAPTPDRVAAADQIVSSVENAVGKLFLIITTSQWEPLSSHVFRREAERSALVGLLAQRRQISPPALPEISKTNSTSSAPDTASISPIASAATVSPTLRYVTWEKLIAAKLLTVAPADPFTSDDALKLDIDPLQPRIWSVGENGVDDGGQGSGENVGRPLDLTWPISPLAPSAAKTDGL